MQEGRYAAGVVRARLRGREHRAFRYRDKGNLATIGQAAAVADIKGVRLSGFSAWATWPVVHLWYLIGFQESAARPHPLVVQLRDPRSRRPTHHSRVDNERAKLDG